VFRSEVSPFTRRGRKFGKRNEQRLASSGSQKGPGDQKRGKDGPTTGLIHDAMNQDNCRFWGRKTSRNSVTLHRRGVGSSLAESLSLWGTVQSLGERPPSSSVMEGGLDPPDQDRWFTRILEMRIWGGRGGGGSSGLGYLGFLGRHQAEEKG